MPTQICQTNSGPNQGPWPAALPQPSPALLPLLSTTESLRETDKTTLIPSVKGISTHSILQGTTLGALMEIETPFLWKGLILFCCPAPGRVLQAGNQKLADPVIFSMGHGMPCFLGPLSDLPLPPAFPGHLSLDNQPSPENIGSSD